MTTTPIIGATNWDGRKRPSDTGHPSASTISNVLHKGALESWMIQTTAEEAAANLGRLAAMSTEDAISWIKGSRWNKKPGIMGAAARGTYLHSVLEHWLEGMTPPDPPSEFRDHLMPYINQLRSWVTEYQPKVILSEAAVVNPELGVAGRGDLWAQLPKHTGDQVWLLDLKTKDDTTKRGHPTKPYGDEALQLASYRYATHKMTFPPRVQGEDKRWLYGGRIYLTSEAELEACESMAEIVGDPQDLRTAIVHLTPFRCEVYEIETGPAVYARLSNARGLWSWLYEEKKGVVGGAWPREVVA